MPNNESNNIDELEKALARLDEIWSANPEDPIWEERCALVDWIDAYEDRHFQIAPPDPVGAIVFRMEQDDLRPKT